MKLDKDWVLLLRDAFQNRPLVDLGSYRFMVNPLTEQAPPIMAALLEAAARSVLAVADLERVTALVSEEDRGGALVGAFSVLSGLPFGMARWHPARYGWICARSTCQKAGSTSMGSGQTTGCSSWWTC